MFRQFQAQTCQLLILSLIASPVLAQKRSKPERPVIENTGSGFRAFQ